MKAFWRVFEYIWPQWPRLIVIVISAILIGILFSLSFMTVVPLLKVMMGEEGLHGWVDRKICGWRYGIDFYVPETIDFTNSENNSIAYYLLITNVELKSRAEAAGLKVQDKIVGVGNAIRQDLKPVSRSRLLEELANAADESSVMLQLKQSGQNGELEDRQLQLNTGTNPFYVEFAVNIAKWIVGFVPRGIATNVKTRAVVHIIILMCMVTIIRCIATFYQKYLAEKVVQIAIADLREDVFYHAMEMPVGFFSSRGTSDTISRIVNDINATGRGVKILLGKALREPLKAIFCLVGAMVISYKLTLIFLCCAPFVLGLAVLLGKKIKKYTRRSLRSSARMLGRLDGAVSALHVVKVYSQQEHESSAYRKINRVYLKQSLGISKVDSATGPIMEVFGMIAGSAALLVGVYWVTSANMQPSSFFGLLVALGISAESIRKSSDIWNKAQSANAAAERVFAVFDEPAEYEKPGAIELPVFKNRIEFKDVVFTYPGSDTPILKGVNLTVQAGYNVAIVGPNGSGKTTLINLLPMFYNTDSGQILIDGVNIRDVTLKSLRSQIGMVTQSVVTFNDTMAANIAYGRPSAAREEIVDAAKRSFADEFISILPKGYDTVIGEHGAGLSGGQLQRVVIARAILKNPAILIFDEATSQVDADSEAKIHNAIEQVMRDRTTFIIAHRFSTVITADVIVVMDDGQIVAQGQHEQLIQTCRLYQSLYETQLVKT
ncbi:MAG: ABC transporter transmembrane domain-containing protein [Planctomycetota bacterium]|jgi:ABC-type multidrug transport system fused ATPase/permease subunit